MTKRLTIAFPIWCLFDTGTDGSYHDLDRVVREHAERGFNCIRCEGGAGLIHDASGKHRRPFRLVEPWTGNTSLIRQSWSFGPGGEVDLLERLLELLRAGHRYGVQVILTSFFYPHTHWYCGDDALRQELYALTPHERFGYFARGLDFLLKEIEAAGLQEQIAYAEIANEIDLLTFIQEAVRTSGHAEFQRFREDLETAMSFLQERHPEIKFAYDTCTPATEPDLFPRNAQAWNFHNYFAWKIYTPVERNLMETGVDLEDPKNLGPTVQFLRSPHIPFEAIRASLGKRGPAEDTWYRRIWLYRNLDPEKMPQLEEFLWEEYLKQLPDLRSRLHNFIEKAQQRWTTICPSAEVFIGEGFSFCTHRQLLLEEHHPEIWELMQEMMDAHKALGASGSVIRTCMGPEDPGWNLCQDRIRELNLRFQD